MTQAPTIPWTEAARAISPATPENTWAHTNGHSPAGFFVRHPHGNRLKFLFEFDYQLFDLSSAASLSDRQCSHTAEGM